MSGGTGGQTRAVARVCPRVSPPDGAPPVTRGTKLQRTEIVHQERPNFGIHWLRGVGDGLVWEEVLHYLVTVVGLTHPVVAKGLWSYQEGVMFDEGVRFVWGPRGGDSKTTCAIEVNGEACEALGWEKLVLLAAPFRLTRCDLAFDGHDLSPRRLRWAYEHKLARTRLQKADWRENDEGQTWTLGKKSSSAQVQCYNRRGFNRLELRLMGARANAFREAGGFKGAVEDARRLGVGFLRQVLDFVDPNSDSNQSRRSLLPWWGAFVAELPKVRVRLPRRAPSTFAGKRSYLVRIQKCLAEVEEYFGRGTVGGVVEDGRRLLRTAQDSVLGRAERPPRRGALPVLPEGGRLSLVAGGA